MKTNHPPSDGITCLCSNCEKPFQLTSDRDDSEGITHIRICSCDSGGVYDAFVDCPYCMHRHDLY